MKIQVLGAGCSNCKKLFELTKQAVKVLNLKAEVEYITDMEKIVAMGVMQSPVLAINGKPVVVGIVPQLEAIKDAIRQSLDNKKHKCCCGSDCQCGRNGS